MPTAVQKVGKFIEDYQTDIKSLTTVAHHQFQIQLNHEVSIANKN